MTIKSRLRSQVGYGLIRGRTSAQIKTLRPYFLTLIYQSYQSISFVFVSGYYSAQQTAFRRSGSWNMTLYSNSLMSAHKNQYKCQDTTFYQSTFKSGFIEHLHTWVSSFTASSSSAIYNSLGCEGNVGILFPISDNETISNGRKGALGPATSTIFWDMLINSPA